MVWEKGNTDLFPLHFQIPFSGLVFFLASKRLYLDLNSSQVFAIIHNFPLVTWEHYNFKKYLPDSIILFYFLPFFFLTSWENFPNAFPNCLHNHLIYSFQCLKNKYSSDQTDLPPCTDDTGVNQRPIPSVHVRVSGG